jgi:hypothetical protein
MEIIERVSMAECKPCMTPVDTSWKHSGDTCNLVSDPTHYRSLASALQYLTFTHPDISYTVQHVYLHMHDLRETHMTTLKHVLRYLQGTLDFGLLLRRSSTSELVVYCDADWVGYLDTHRSTSRYAIFLSDDLISCSSKRQNMVSHSSAEAEYRVVANGVVDTSWLRQLLMELHSRLTRSTLVYCDNVSIVYLASNPVQLQRTKHVRIDLHFVRDKVAIGEVHVLHVPMTSHFIDIFTKGMPSPLFSEFPSSLKICRD